MSSNLNFLCALHELQTKFVAEINKLYFYHPLIKVTSKVQTEPGVAQWSRAIPRKATSVLFLFHIRKITFAATQYLPTETSQKHKNFKKRRNLHCFIAEKNIL